jgi:uncharacterized protein YcbK (DUF882 family)
VALPVLLALTLAAIMMATSAASAETRTLKLHFTHTNERAEVTFKRNGRYIKEGLNKINWILRDWRQNQATEMDPRLLDLLWEVYQQSGSRAYIHVISAYRSPATNNMLRSRSSGVADNSQHTRGRAIDFFLPDVSPARLRELGLRRHGGGVGYYPRSGSPFVHLDTGSVRHWPRMNRQQLMAVFPDGRTMHVPSDGRPLPGYEQALAAYEQRQRSQPSVQIASASSTSASSGSSGPGLLAALFGGGSGSSSASQASAPSGTGSTAAAAATSTPSRPTAPVRQAEPEATPQSILAALPASRIPIPMPAPRPSVAVGAQVEAAQAETIPFEVRDEAEIQEELEQRDQLQLAANVPLPKPRPDRATPSSVGAEASLIALAEQSSDPATEAIERQLASASVPIPMLRPARTGSVPDRGEASAQEPEAEERPVVLAALPTPGGIPEGLGATPSSSDRAEALVLKERAAASARDSRLAPISAAASPRAAIMDREAGTTVVAALESGVRTTARAARPNAQDARARGRRAVSRPIEGELKRWVFEAKPITAVTNATRAPHFAPRVLTSAPRTVYTAGFQKAAPHDTGRFSGQAVQFMTVARFGTN